MKSMSMYVSILITVLIFWTGCASKGKPQITAATPIQEWSAPEWVVKGSGAFEEEKGKAFYGVGYAVGIYNHSMLRTAADNRARNDMAKILQFYTASLMRDYMATTMAGNDKEVTDEQHIEQAIKTVTAMTLSGVQIVDHWQNPETGEIYALAKLDMEAFKNNIDKVRELDANVRDYIRKNAERLHEQLEKEEQKHRIE